uniref:Uncharacterized protein n=1 Tax=Meloidogyne enterolobii TaxID=390850 RepID=A0A6V7Y1V3_MELEN|nr:unnamed protein product [Meloidogyne enterolobii]
MKIFNNKLIFILLIIIHLFTYFEPNNGCGFPVPQSAPPVCVCGGGGGGGYGCGGGGGGCCGRRKREVIQPHFKGVELPCPQTEWSLIMEKAILPNNPTTSINSIQTALFSHFPGTKFITTCDKTSKAIDNNKEENKIKEMPIFSAAGDGYCNVVVKEIWCQVVALQA